LWQQDPAAEDRAFIFEGPTSLLFAAMSPSDPRPAPAFSTAVNGLLFVASDVDAADEADFNRWYDKEHVEERVRIPGFLSGARYLSLEGGRKYLGLYRTESLEVFRSAGYRAAFERQTPWSVANLDRMRQPMRRVCAVRAVTGFGSGSHLAVLPLPAQDAGAEALAARAAEAGRGLAQQPGFVQSYLLVPDTTLSTPLPRESALQRELLPMLVVEASSAGAARAARTQAAAALDTDPSTAWLLALGWKLTAAELN
jgi:heme-degrading monooxygenase HmoA